MTTKYTGGPAFPCEVSIGVAAPDANGINRYLTEPYEGMTLRDYFAAKAMQGMLANQALTLRFIDNRAINDENRDRAIGAVAAISAYAVADAMLAERIKS